MYPAVAILSTFQWAAITAASLRSAGVPIGSQTTNVVIKLMLRRQLQLLAFQVVSRCLFLVSCSVLPRKHAQKPQTRNKQRETRNRLRNFSSSDYQPGTASRLGRDCRSAYVLQQFGGARNTAPWQFPLDRAWRLFAVPATRNRSFAVPTALPQKIIQLFFIYPLHKPFPALYIWQNFRRLLLPPGLSHSFS